MSAGRRARAIDWGGVARMGFCTGRFQLVARVTTLRT